MSQDLIFWQEKVIFIQIHVIIWANNTIVRLDHYVFH